MLKKMQLACLNYCIDCCMIRCLLLASDITVLDGLVVKLNVVEGRLAPAPVLLHNPLHKVCPALRPDITRISCLTSLSCCAACISLQRV